MLLDSTEIIGVVQHSLSKIDPRLVDHGERVGYIAARMRSFCPDESDIDPSVLSILCALHDIGAYKTNEIDDMVRFETERTLDHSLYGYLFIKHISPLSEYAEAILYHHTDYAELEKQTCACARYAELIHLADRADILLHSPAGDLRQIKAFSGTRFNPRYVDALFQAEAHFDVSKNIRTGSYTRSADEFKRQLIIPNGDIFTYLRLLVYAMDFRSPYTVTHTADTALISLETAHRMGLGEDECERLYIGAFLHDIGKIAIPHALLEKPARLTPEEMAVVQGHIPEGEQILRGVVSDEICDIALHHHEKLDGSGYSWGLTAEALSLQERIVAVADILSALSQRRSYKEPFPKPQVISMLNEMKASGKLCPRVVDTVCTHYDQILGDVQRSSNPVKTLYSRMVREYDALHTLS